MASGRSWISGSVSRTSEMRSALAMALEKWVDGLAGLRIGLYMLVRYPTTTVSSPGSILCLRTSSAPNDTAAAVPTAVMISDDRVAAASRRATRILSRTVSAVTASNCSSSYFSRANACTKGIARPRPVMEGQRQRLQMGEELSAQRIHHAVPDGRGDEDLRVREQAAPQRDRENPGRRRDQQPDFVVGDRVRQQAQGARQGIVVNDVIEDDLQGPRLQQLHRGGPHRADRRDGQAPFDLTQMRQEDLAESRACARHCSNSTASTCRSASASGWRARSNVRT